eukprot:TRINITY_DN28522_c0_g1_i1.p1 TRINITY_DN28522_c0_g1~~TRINITY_DN28522_c0_g1_i1.p1  ORF type:complete len:223 (-),score=58.46 TRINITY_DN28522_c0_g1_i1:173-841(-)
MLRSLVGSEMCIRDRDGSSSSGDGGVVPNRGLRDQLEALRWVKRNIQAFGGDPDNITVGGQSAGAMSVGCLLGVDACYDEELFHKAIMQSGTAHHIYSESVASDIFANTARVAGMSEEAFRKYILTAPIKELVRIQAKVENDNVYAYRHHTTPHILPFQPHVDASFGGCDSSILPIHPITAVKARVQRHRQQQQQQQQLISRVTAREPEPSSSSSPTPTTSS